MKPAVPNPVEQVVLDGGETELRVQLVEDERQAGTLLLDIRLHRLRPGDPATADRLPTAAGFRVALHHAPALTKAIEQLARRGAEAALWAPAPGSTRPGS